MFGNSQIRIKVLRSLKCRFTHIFCIKKFVFMAELLRGYSLHSARSTSSFRGAYCLSGSGYMVQVAGLIAYHAAGLHHHTAVL